MAGGNKNHSPKVKKRKAQREAVERTIRAAKAQSRRNYSDNRAPVRD
jgi:hypothetical protein